MSEDNDKYAENFLEKTKNKINLSFSPLMLIPGDVYNCNPNNLQSTLKIGWGLKQHENNQETPLFSCSSAGILSYRPNSNSYWIEHSDKKRYCLATAKVGDQIIGIIEDKGSDFYTVNIFCGFHCILNRLSFEGATKRNKPELKRGVNTPLKQSIATENNQSSTGELEITCMSGSGSKKEWSTGETIYGELPQGILIHVSLSMARELLKPESVVLNSLGRNFLFEVAVGMNGAICVLDTIVIRNAILNSEYLEDDKVEAMVEKLVQLSNRRKT